MPERGTSRREFAPVVELRSSMFNSPSPQDLHVEIIEECQTVRRAESSTSGELCVFVHDFIRDDEGWDELCTSLCEVYDVYDDGTLAPTLAYRFDASETEDFEAGNDDSFFVSVCAQCRNFFFVNCSEEEVEVFFAGTKEAVMLSCGALSLLEFLQVLEQRVPWTGEEPAWIVVFLNSGMSLGEQNDFIFGEEGFEGMFQQLTSNIRRISLFAKFQLSFVALS